MFLCVFGLSSTVFSSNDDLSEGEKLLLVAKATKAILEEGKDLSNLLEADFGYVADMVSGICVLLTTHVEPNTVCPDSIIGPTFSSGEMACFDRENAYVRFVTSMKTDASDCF